MKHKLPEILTQLRAEAQYSQKDVAKVIGIERSTYCYYETGRAQPKPDIIVKLAFLYDVSLDYLFFGDALQEGKQGARNNFLLNSKEIELLTQIRNAPNSSLLQTYMLSFLQEILAQWPVNDAATILWACGSGFAPS